MYIIKAIKYVSTGLQAENPAEYSIYLALHCSMCVDPGGGQWPASAPRRLRVRRPLRQVPRNGSRDRVNHDNYLALHWAAVVSASCASRMKQ